MKTLARKKTKKKLCAHGRCRQEAITQGFCRLHYLANWKHMKFNAQVKAERRLNSFVNRMAKKYPDDYLERIKEGLEDEEKFKRSVQELDTDEAESQTEREYLEKFSRNVKGE